MMHSSDSRRAPDIMERIRLALGLALRPVRPDLPSRRHLLRLAGPGRTLSIVHAVRCRPAPLRACCGRGLFDRLAALRIRPLQLRLLHRLQPVHDGARLHLAEQLLEVQLRSPAGRPFGCRVGAAVSAACPADQRPRQTGLCAIAPRPRAPSEIHSGAGAGHDRRGLILQFQAGVDQADLRFSQRTPFSGRRYAT